MKVYITEHVLTREIILYREVIEKRGAWYEITDPDTGNPRFYEKRFCHEDLQSAVAHAEKLRQARVKELSKKADYIRSIKIGVEA